MDVRIDFTGEARDAQAAALSIDKALEGIEAIAKQVATALDGIRLDLRQVMEVQTGARSMGAALRDVTVRGTEAAEAVGRVGRGFNRQTAEVVAGSAAASAALRGLEMQAHSTQRSLIATSVLGGTTPGPRAPQSMLAAAVRGETFTPPAPRPSPMGFVSAPPPRRVFRAGQNDNYGFAGLRSIPGMGNFGLESSGRHRMFGVGPLVGGEGGGGSILGRFGSIGDKGDGRGGFFSRGNGFDGGLLAGALPGGARPGPAAVGVLASLGVAAAPTLLPAVIGPLAAIPGLVGTGVAALGTLVAAFHGVGKAIAGDAQAYKALNAEQQQFVLSARGLAPFLAQLKDVAAKNLVPGVTSGLQRAFSPAAQSTLSTGVGQIGSALGAGANQLGGLLGGGFFTGLSGDLFKDAAKNLRVMADAVTNLLSAVTSFAHGAQPITDWIVQTADDGARWIATWARMKDETGAFNGYLDRTKTAWSDLIGIGGGVIRVVTDLAGILGGAGKIAITGLIDGLDGLDHWLTVNRQALSDVASTIAKDLVEAIHVVGPLILDLVSYAGKLLEMLRELPGPLKAIGDAAVVAGIIALAGGFSAMSTGVGAIIKLLPVLQAGLIALAANPEILALLAGLAALAAIKDPGAFMSSGGDPNAGGKPGNVSASEAKKMLAAAGNPKPFATAGGTTAYQLGNGQLLSNRGGVWSAYYQDNAVTVYGKASGYTPPKGVSIAAPARSGGNAAPTHASASGPAAGYSIPKSAGSGGAAGLTGKKLVDYITARANALGLDPVAALAMASAEGGFQGAVGDGGHAFGPYQANNAGGVATGMSGARAQAYFQSSQGVEYMLRYHASTAKGLSGQSAIIQMIQNERPGDYLAGVKRGLTPTAAAMGTRDYTVAMQYYNQARTTGNIPPGTVPSKNPIPWQLPIALQVALAKAQTTPGMADDRSAIGRAMDYLRGIGVGSGNRQPMFTIPGSHPGMIAAGNIDLANRPVAHNKDGSISTVRSIDITQDGIVVSIPTVVGGKVVSNKAAIQNYMKTGQYLGKFSTQGAADAYDVALHQQQAQMYLGATSPKLAGADLVNAYQELKSLQDMLASIAKASKSNLVGLKGLGDVAARGLIRTPAASTASLLSIGRLGSGLLGDIGAAQTSGAGLGDFGLTGLRGQAQHLMDQLAMGMAMTPAQVATIRQKLLNLKPAITGALDEIAQAARARTASFKATFEDLAQQAVSAFEKETNDVLAHPEKHAGILPLTAQLLGLEDAHTQQALQDQLAQAQENLAKALAGATSDSSGILAAAREKIGKDALAHAIDVAQSAVLGIKPGDMTDQIIKDMQEALRAGAPDPAEVEKAQKDVSDAVYAIKVNGLEKQATAEQDAYRDSRSELETHLQKSLALWETYFGDLGHGSAQALADLNAVLAKFGLSPLGAGALTTPGGPPTSQDWASQVGVTSGFSPGIPADQLAGMLFGTPGGINPSTGQPYVGFADGGVSLNPMLARVSEKGAEAHIPLNDPQALSMIGDAIAKAGGGGNVAVIVNVQDQALRDLIDVQIVENADTLSYSQGTNASRLYREGRV